MAIFFAGGALFRRPGVDRRHGGTAAGLRSRRPRGRDPVLRPLPARGAAGTRGRGTPEVPRSAVSGRDTSYRRALKLTCLKEGQGSALDPPGAAPPDLQSRESPGETPQPNGWGSGASGPSGSRAEPWPSLRCVSSKARRYLGAGTSSATRTVLACKVGSRPSAWWTLRCGEAPALDNRSASAKAVMLLPEPGAAGPAGLVAPGIFLPPGASKMAARFCSSSPGQPAVSGRGDGPRSPASSRPGCAACANDRQPWPCRSWPVLPVHGGSRRAATGPLPRGAQGVSGLGM